MCLLASTVFVERPQRMWKVCSFVYMASLWWQCMLISFFLFYVVPTGQFSNKSSFMTAKEYLEHLLPCSLVVGDWCLNAIVGEQNHIWVNCWPAIAYFATNAALTLSRGTPVYRDLDWQSVSTLWVLVIAFPLMVLEWAAIVWLTNKKLVWLKAVQTLQEQQQAYECRNSGQCQIQSQGGSSQGSTQSSRQSHHDLLAQISKFKHDSDGNLVFR